MYSIIYRLLQIALGGYMVKVCPASCQVIVNRVERPFAITCRRPLHNLGHVVLCPPRDHGPRAGQCNTGLWNKLTFHHLHLKDLPKKGGRLLKKQLLLPLAVYHHISSIAIVLQEPYIPTKNSLQVFRHFTGPQQIPSMTVFINFVPRHPSSNKSPKKLLLLNLPCLKYQKCPIQSKSRESCVVAVTVKKYSNLLVKHSRKTTNSYLHLDTFDLSPKGASLALLPSEEIKPLNPPA